MTQDFEQTTRAEDTSVKIILLVEDDESISEVFVQAISQETPYLPVLVRDAFEALKIVQSMKPHLFILDYQLPRMNGIELYDKLHSITNLTHIPAIMVSARLPYQELEKRNILAMAKPIDLDDFLLAIDQLLA